MNNKTFAEMTTDEKIVALRSMTIEERIEALRPIFAAPAPRVISFGKAPKGGFTDADRVK